MKTRLIQHPEARIGLRLVGEDVTADEFRASVNAFFGLLGAISREVCGHGVKWIATVKEASVGMAGCPASVLPRIDHVEQLPFIITKGISTLNESAVRPPHFNDEAMEFLRRLAEIRRNGSGIRSVEVSAKKRSVAVSPNIADSVTRVLGHDVKTHGALEGILITLTARDNDLWCVLEDRLSKLTTEVDITEGLYEEAKRLHRHRVYVPGEVTYDRKGKPIRIRAESFRELGGAGVPSIEEMRGFLLRG